MADPSRQPFRFRLPWMINPLSNLTNQRTTQPTATIPVQRTIRAPTVPLPPPSPPPPPPPPKTEPKPPSPARSGPQSGMASQSQTQSRAASQPPSPSRTSPPSPSRTTPPSQVASLPPSTPRTSPASPSRTTPPSQVASLPPSPPRTTLSQPQVTQKTESQPPSPSRTISQTPLPSQITPSRSETPPMMESKTVPTSQVSPRTTPQLQASAEPQSPSRPTHAQSQAPPNMESKPAPPSPAAPRTTPQSKSTSEPPSPSRTIPSQSQTPPKTVSKPQPPSPAALQSGMSSQPPSPSRASKTQLATRTVSHPPSPSPTNTQVLPASRVPSKPSSPTHLASQAANRTAPQSPSSSRTASKVATIQTTSQPPSPSRQVSRSQTKTQASTNSSSPPKSSVSKTEPSSDKTTKSEPTIFHPLSQDPTPQSQNQIQFQAASAQAEVKRQPSQILGPAVVMSTSPTAPPEIPATQPLKSYAVPIDPKKHQNLEAETKETKEEKPKLESSRKEDKPMIVVNEEPKQMKKSTDFFNIAAGSNKQPQVRSSTTSQGKHNHLNKQVHEDDKNMAQESKTTTTTRPQKDMNANSESQPRPPVSQGEQATLHKEIKESIFGVIHKLGDGHTTHGMDGPVSVITLTGENKGASMHVGAELARKEGPVHIHRGYKLNQDDKNEMTTDGESSSKRKPSNPINKEDEASTAYINSNVQSINNSIMSNSSISERSPGVRWVLEHSQIEPAKNKNQKSVEAHKADFNVTHSQKLTYQPTVRRRCLRGLLLEPSDSDPDNPEKPRRHGCRYSCDEKKKCKDNGKEGTTVQF